MGGNAAEKLLDPVLTAATICRQHLANETPFLSLCLFVLLCSTSTLVNVQLRKIILKKISLSWWTTRSLVSLFIFMFICFFMFLCIDSFIDSFIASKTIENLINRRAVDLVASEEKPKKLVPQTSFKLFKIFNENLVAVEWANVELTLSRPTYVEFAILDLWKRWCMISTKLIKRVTCTKTFMLISICSIFLGTTKKVHSTMVKTKWRTGWMGKLQKSLSVWGRRCIRWKQRKKKGRRQRV